MRVEPFFHQSGAVIYHGDCLDILPTLKRESVDFVLTDPPYLVGFRGRWDQKRKTIAGDEDATWVAPAFREIFRVLKRGTFCVSFYGWPHADLFVGTWKELGFRVVSHLAFVKNVWGLGRFTRGQHETAYLLAKGRPPVPRNCMSDTIEWEREQDALHPNQKPVKALYPLLRAFAPEHGTVLDPFIGSGSTLRAAKDFGLESIGIEIERKYCKLAARRMEQLDLFSYGAQVASRSEEDPPDLFANQ